MSSVRRSSTLSPTQSSPTEIAAPSQPQDLSPKNSVALGDASFLYSLMAQVSLTVYIPVSKETMRRRKGKRVVQDCSYSIAQDIRFLTTCVTVPSLCNSIPSR
ncbi:hypothetical protein RHMOL_Rhmol04G0291600 [Rhododendron molle]|nr:hypothetical protein RHMOL_Rhmol04G0291600 [Rhododendron molle]KAI8560896.1 hypothetical protein RHMOL_Rhmol04G0291600 [Rhododendron molle]